MTGCWKPPPQNIVNTEVVSVELRERATGNEAKVVDRDALNTIVQWLNDTLSVPIGVSEVKSYPKPVNALTVTFRDGTTQEFLLSGCSTLEPIDPMPFVRQPTVLGSGGRQFFSRSYPRALVDALRSR